MTKGSASLHGGGGYAAVSSHKDFSSVADAFASRAPVPVRRLGSLTRRHYHDRSSEICAGGDHQGIELVDVLFHVGHGSVCDWGAPSGLDVLQACVHFGDESNGKNPGGLRYLLMGTCRVFAHGPLVSGDYLAPGRFYASYPSQNVWERWRNSLGTGARFAAGGCSEILVSEPIARRFWDLHLTLKADMVDSFLLAFHSGPTSVPLCVARGGSEATQSPLLDRMLVDADNPWDSANARMWAAYLEPCGSPWPPDASQPLQLTLSAFTPLPAPLWPWLERSQGSLGSQVGNAGKWTFDSAGRRDVPALQGLPVDYPGGVLDSLFPGVRLLDPLGVTVGGFTTKLLPEKATEDEVDGWTKSRTVVCRRLVRLRQTDGTAEVLVPQLDDGGTVVVQVGPSGTALGVMVDWRATTFASVSDVVGLEAARSSALEGRIDYEVVHSTWGYKEIDTVGDTSVLAPFYRFRVKPPPTATGLFAPHLEIFVPGGEFGPPPQVGPG